MGMNPYFKRNDYKDTPRERPSYSSNVQTYQRDKADQRQTQITEVIKKIQGLKSMSELDPKDFADRDGMAWKVASEIRNNLKTSQLRKFFEPLVAIETDLKKNKTWDPELENRVYLVLPTLAYAVGRKLAPEDFYNLIDACIKKINTQGAKPEDKAKNFERFMEFLRSIVAYNKYLGGD